MGFIMTKEMVRDEAFKELMRLQKCPFRLKKVSRGSDILDEMMPCDPDCAALITKADKSSYSCLRLMSAQYPLKYENGIEIFRGLDKEEDQCQ